MSWQVLVTVFTLGGIGAMIRGIVIFILAQSAYIFPISIILVNILSAFLGGFILSVGLPTDMTTAMSVGLIGGIGTLSTININILDLIFDKGFRRIGIYLLLTVVLGASAAFAGQGLGSFVYKHVIEQQQQENEAIKQLLQSMQVNNSSQYDELHLDDNITNLPLENTNDSKVQDTTPIDSLETNENSPNQPSSDLTHDNQVKEATSPVAQEKE